jgi:hypothetical protein
MFLEHSYCKTMKNPIALCLVEDIVEGQRLVLYGEYIWNSAHHEVGIWARVNGYWKRVNEFGPNTITHIHNIVYDKYRNEFVICTGDQNSESGLWRLSVDFSTITPIVTGSQQYRTCAVYPLPDGLLYATDTPIADNALYKVKYTYDGKVESIKKHYDMPGPCIYTKSDPSAFYMATSVEPDSSLSTLCYRLTRKLGVGVKDRYCHIIMYKDGYITEITRFLKDVWPMWLFQFGNCQFPRDYKPIAEDKHLQITPCSVKKFDGKTIVID